MNNNDQWLLAQKTKHFAFPLRLIFLETSDSNPNPRLWVCVCERERESEIESARACVRVCVRACLRESVITSEYRKEGSRQRNGECE